MALLLLQRLNLQTAYILYECNQVVIQTGTAVSLDCPCWDWVRGKLHPRQVPCTKEFFSVPAKLGFVLVLFCPHNGIKRCKTSDRTIATSNLLCPDVKSSGSPQCFTPSVIAMHEGQSTGFKLYSHTWELYPREWDIASAPCCGKRQHGTKHEVTIRLTTQTKTRQDTMNRETLSISRGGIGW